MAMPRVSQNVTPWPAAPVITTLEPPLPVGTTLPEPPLPLVTGLPDPPLPLGEDEPPDPLGTSPIFPVHPTPAPSAAAKKTIVQHFLFVHMGLTSTG